MPRIQNPDLWNSCLTAGYEMAPTATLREQREAFLMVADAESCRRRTVVAGASRRFVEDILYPGSYAPRLRANHNGRQSVRRGSGMGRAGLFHGRDWEQVAITPFYVNADEVVGYAFYDAYAPTPTDALFKSYGKLRGGFHEAGLAMLPAAVSARGAEWNDCVFIVLDFAAALRLQLKWCRGSRWPAPVVVPWDDEKHRTEQAWDQLPQQERILLAAAVNEPTIRQARLANARIVICPHELRKMRGPSKVDRTPLSVYIAQQPFGGLPCSYSPVAMLRSLRGLAQPWQHVLEGELRERTPTAALRLLNDIGLHGRARSTFLEGCSYNCRSHLADALDATAFAPRTTCKSRPVVERDGGWFLEDNGQRICDAVRITRILRTTTGERRLTVAVERSDGRRESMLRDEDVRRLGLLGCLRRHFLAVGADFTYLAGWSVASETIAVDMHPPQIIAQADSVGWSCDCVFRLPRFGITLQGFSAADSTPLLHDRQPARDLEIPRPIDRRAVRPLTWISPDSAAFWATVRMVVLYVTAPAFQRTMPNCLLLGAQQDEMAAALAESLGCIRYAVPAGSHTRRARKRIHHEVNEHRWPAILHLPQPSRLGLAADLQGLPEAGCFVAPTCEPTADDLLADLAVLELRAGPGAANLVREFTAMIVLNYLAVFRLRQRKMVRYPQGRWDLAVWEDFGHWFGAIARGGPARAESEKLLSLPNVGRMRSFVDPKGGFGGAEFVGKPALTDRKTAGAIHENFRL